MLNNIIFTFSQMEIGLKKHTVKVDERQNVLADKHIIYLSFDMSSFT